MQFNPFPQIISGEHIDMDRILELGLHEQFPNVFYPKSNIGKVVEPHTKLFFRDTQIGSEGNVTTIVAQFGAGKTQVCEAIVSSRLSHENDSLGIELKSRFSIAYIETELSKWDATQSYQRIIRRAKIDEDKIDYPLFEYYNIRMIPLDNSSKYNRMNFLTSVLKNPLFDVVVVDGIADFVLSVNDEKECSLFISELLSLIQENNKLLVLTLHSNPRDDKARGHLGSEILRKSEGILYILKDENGRKITTESMFGKTRNSSTKSTLRFDWDSEHEYFVTSPNQSDSNDEKAGSQKSIFATIKAENPKIDWWKRSDLSEEFAKRVKRTSRTSQRAILTGIAHGYLIVSDDSKLIQII
jgi:hypothetical protein